MILLEVDPNVVKPGWTALVVTILLALALVLLFLSMRRQFRKINIVPPESEPAETDQPETDRPEQTPTERKPTEPTPGPQA